MVKKRVCEAWRQEDRMIKKVKGFTTMKERKKEKLCLMNGLLLIIVCSPEYAAGKTKIFCD